MVWGPPCQRFFVRPSIMKEIKGLLIVDYDENAELRTDEVSLKIDDVNIINNLCCSIPGNVGGDFSFYDQVEMLCELNNDVITNVALLIVRREVCDHYVKGISD